MTAAEPKSTARARRNTRSAARLAAAQALYQIRATDVSADSVIAEFSAHRFGREIDGALYAPADEELFADIVRGVEVGQEEIDGLIGQALDRGWKLERLERIMLALLQAGTYELLSQLATPAPVIIDEYVDLAHAFYSGGEPRFVNGVLDRLAKEIRAPAQEP